MQTTQDLFIVDNRVIRDNGDKGVIVQIGTGYDEGRIRVKWDHSGLRTWVNRRFLTAQKVEK